MILVARKRSAVLAALAILILSGLLVVNFGFAGTTAGNMNYRVFVAGIGTIEGKWSGETGIAVIGLETRPAQEAEMELKVIDLLIANNSSETMLFNSDVGLIDGTGQYFGLTAKGQPEVKINPGALSQGTVIISVPKGVPDREWTLEVKGGNLRDPLLLPLKIIRVLGDQPRLEE